MTYQLGMQYVFNKFCSDSLLLDVHHITHIALNNQKYR
jgi:hypothetical protein